MWRGIGAVLGGWLVGDFWFVACFGWFLGEPVVHSAEWTTGSELFLVFVPFSAISGELVVHSMEWTTGAAPFLVFGPFPAFSGELVVHSTEWTTGSALFLVFESSPKSCVKICRLSYSLFAFGEVDQEGACVSLPSIV